MDVVALRGCMWVVCTRGGRHGTNLLVFFIIIVVVGVDIP